MCPSCKFLIVWYRKLGQWTTNVNACVSKCCDFCAQRISSKCQDGGDGLVVKARVCFENLINRGSPSQFIKNLLDSDTCSLDGWFSKEHFWVRCDPFSI